MKIMFNRMVGIFIALMVSLVFYTGCGDGGSDPTNVATTTSSTLSLTVTDTASSSLSTGELSALDSDIEIAAISDYTISCKDEDGNTYTATIDSEGNASVESLPTDKKMICHLLDSSGNPVTQLFDDYSSVIGGKVDAFGVESDTSATVSFNSNAKGADMTCADCTNATSSSSGIDVTGTYTMNCTGIYNSTTDVLDTSKSCEEDFDGGTVYMHRVQYTDADGNSIDSYGAWPSLAAFQACGSTEGLDNLPTGATLVTAGQGAAFDWDGGFGSFTSSSTTTEIAGFISHADTSTLATANSLQSYAAFNAATCTDPFTSNTNTCETMYYWQQLDNLGRAGTACLPQLGFTWGNSGVSAITAKSSNGGTTNPSTRFDFMNVQWYGSEMRMVSLFAEVFPAWDSTNNTSVNCRFKEEMLISIATPGTTPTTGDTVTAKFVSNTDIASISGVTSDDTVCTQQFGSASTAVANGYYMLVTMTMQ